MESEAVRILIGISGLIFTMLALWHIDRESYDLETKVGLKVAGATFFFSMMMFTPLISLDGGFIKVGILAFPSAKLATDAVIMAFLASALRDLVKKEMERD